jgi:tRNA dimethylallyltransferase
MNTKILILGTTASGKGKLAFGLAQTSDAEIISIDSMKVYRRMDIGTAKPPKNAREKINYHLIDIIEPSQSFNVATFLELAEKAIEQIAGRNKPVIAVGGTAMYIKALLFGLFEGPGTNGHIRNELKARAQNLGTEELYRQLAQIDPAAAQRISSNDARRIIRALEVYEITGKPISLLQKQWDSPIAKADWFIIGLRRGKTDTSSRINKRAKKMLEAGLVDEVKSLLAEEKPLSKQARCAIGYAEIIDYLNGKTTLEDALEMIKKNTRRLAKSQRTWFKTFTNVNWLDIEPEEPPEKTLTRTKELLKHTEQLS